MRNKFVKGDGIIYINFFTFGDGSVKFKVRLFTKSEKPKGLGVFRLLSIQRQPIYVFWMLFLSEKFSEKTLF